jgi:hypothetical protein
MHKINGVLSLLITLVISTSAMADARGFNRNDGNYIQPTIRNNTDRNLNNNWPTQGDFNQRFDDQFQSHRDDFDNDNDW